MKEDLKKTAEELVKNEEFMKYLLSLDTAEEMSEELKNRDIEISPDEIRQIGILLRKKASGELDDKELQEVWGGMALTLAEIIVSVIVSVVVGGMITTAAVCRNGC